MKWLALLAAIVVVACGRDAPSDERLSPVMVSVPGAKFSIAKAPVTVAEFEACVHRQYCQRALVCSYANAEAACANEPAAPPAPVAAFERGNGDGSAPVTDVDPAEARAYCYWVDSRLASAQELGIALADPRAGIEVIAAEIVEPTYPRDDHAARIVSAQPEVSREIDGFHRTDSGFRCARGPTPPSPPR